MSPNGQTQSDIVSTAPAVLVGSFSLPAGVGFDWHDHREHQLTWAARGVLSVETRAGTWVLPPTRALLIPAMSPHRIEASLPATMCALYVRGGDALVEWSSVVAVAVGPLMAELIRHLGGDGLDPDHRRRSERLLIDLLEPVPALSVDVPLPVDARAREVADAILSAPSDDRDLRSWGHQVGASGRTLARAFRGDTGLTFGQWRALARISAALPALAAGTPVSSVARQVGFHTASAFVDSFRRHTGTTPGAYFAR